MEQWADAPMRSIAPLIYCSRFCVPRAFHFSALHCSIVALLTLFRPLDQRSQHLGQNFFPERKRWGAL